MYLHIGNNKNIVTKDIVGIFNLDDTAVSQSTKAFLKKAEKEKNLILVAEELPKSFLVVQKKKKDIIKKENHTVVYLSQLASATLVQRTAQKMK